MCHLRFFEINVYLGEATSRDFAILSSLMGSLSMSLTSPATLERLKFNIQFEGDNEDFINDEEFYHNLRVADAWSYLNSIADHPTGSRLERVDININYRLCYKNEYEYSEPNRHDVLQAVLDGLPLLQEKGILFVVAHGQLGS